MGTRHDGEDCFARGMREIERCERAKGLDMSYDVGGVKKQTNSLMVVTESRSPFCWRSSQALDAGTATPRIEAAHPPLLGRVRHPATG